MRLIPFKAGYDTLDLPKNVRELALTITDFYYITHDNIGAHSVGLPHTSYSLILKFDADGKLIENEM